IRTETRPDVWIELQEIRDRLPRNSVLIDIVRLTPRDFDQARGKSAWKAARYFAWITPPVGEIKVVDLGDADVIAAAAGAVRDDISTAPKTIQTLGAIEAEKRMRQPLAKISALVLHPLLPHIDKQSQWIFCPDSELWLVPFNALLLPGDKYV